jgi:hypothetical protein
MSILVLVSTDIARVQPQPMRAMSALRIAFKKGGQPRWACKDVEFVVPIAFVRPLPLGLSLVMWVRGGQSSHCSDKYEPRICLGAPSDL